MKSKLIFAAATLAICLVACEKKEEKPQVSNIEISEHKEMLVDSLQESIEFVLQSGVLHVTHNNVLGSCETTEQLNIYCMISNDSLYLIEDDKSGPNCLFIYDLTYCISPFEAGIWNISLNNDTTFMVTIDETKRKIAL